MGRQTESGLLVDVRSPEEYATGWLSEAVNIPYTDIVDGLNTGRVVPHDARIVLYCRSGRRSAIAKTTLEAEGYRNVTDLGSFEDAQAVLKLPVSRKADIPAELF